jgi:alpha-ketoglutarate-dependent taurine dioxygenase
MSGIEVVSGADGRDDPARWLAEHAADLTAAFDRTGAVLVRGLDVLDEAGAAEVSRCLTGAPLTEREPFAPRTGHGAGLYSSTVWPADQPMCMHHELSYALEVPRRQVFCCLVAPEKGGATALADAAAVLRDLPADLVDRFERHGWVLVRAHNDVVGVPWQEAFGTDEPSEVERYCRDNDIEWRWDGAGGLGTRRRRPAVIRHPVSGERLWFNQVAFLNEWTMEPAVREYLTLEFGPDGLPFNTLSGDGEPLDKGTVDLINDVYTAHAVREPWWAGDVLLVDNLRMAHSRDPYRGQRRVTVSFGEPVRPAELALPELSVEAQ